LFIHRKKPHSGGTLVMVLKHELVSENEQHLYTPAMLQVAWDKLVPYFQSFLDTPFSNEAVIGLVEYLSTSQYATRFYPGSSLGTLLISKPEPDGRLNYQRTLAISVDNNTNLIQLEYSDWDTIDDEADWKKAIIWTATCEGPELKTTFEAFIAWNTAWK